MFMVVLMMMFMIVVMIMAATSAVLIVIVMMMLRCLHLRNDLGNGCAAFHSFLQLSAGQFSPRGSDNGSIGIVLFQHLYRGIQFLLRYRVSTGKNDTSSGFNLVIIELSEVLHIDLDLIGIHNRNGTAQLYILACNLFHRTDDIGQLANTGRFNDNAVGVVFINDLCQRTTKVAYQTAADTTGVHLGNIDTCFLQKASINANLTEFVFDQHKLLTLVAFGNHLFNQSGLTGTQKAGVNINFCHKNHLSFIQKIQLLSVFPLRLHFLPKGYYTTHMLIFPPIFRTLE